MSSTNDERSRYTLIPVPPDAKQMDFVTDIPQSFQVDMLLIHNVFIRALNNIYYYAPRIKKGDETAFAGYVMAFAESLHLHHHGEEEILFPFLQPKNDMVHNIEQHDAFKDQVQVLADWMKDVFNGKEEYSGSKVRELVESFGGVLVEHLHDEIATITPDHIAVYSAEELMALTKRQTEHIQTFPITTAHPFVYTHHERQTAPAWPPVPGPVKFLVENVIYWWHRSYWQFSPFTRTGEPLEYNGA